MRRVSPLTHCAILSVFATGSAQATSCSYPPPCYLLDDRATLFVGKVIGNGPAEGNISRTSRLEVVEAFHGVPAGIREVTLGMGLDVGEGYFVNGYTAANGTVWPAICGQTSETTYAAKQGNLRYLRESARNPKRSASLTIQLDTDYVGMPGVPVSIIGPKGRSVTKTNAQGLAHFKKLPPGHYRLANLPEHRRPNPEFPQRTELDLLPGGCQSLRVSLVGDGSVGGTLRSPEGRPLSGVVMEMARTDEHSFLTITDENGRFRFENISEGAYRIGINIRQRRGSLPRWQASGEVLVKPGQRLDGLELIPPDPGGKRAITIRVLNTSGQPVADAFIDDGRASDTLGALHGVGLNGPKTNSDGEVTIDGWQRVPYEVTAIKNTGSTIRDMYRADRVLIPSAVGDASIVLTLKPVFAR